MVHTAQAVLECRACPARPARQFGTQNAWQLHLKTAHVELGGLAGYRALHGDPDLAKFRHTCRLCNTDLGNLQQ